MRLDLCQVWSFHAITITVSPRAHAWALFLTALMSLASFGCTLDRSRCCKMRCLCQEHLPSTSASAVSQN